MSILFSAHTVNFYFLETKEDSAHTKKKMSSKPAEAQAEIPEIIRDPTSEKVYQKGKFLGQVLWNI